MGSETQKVRGAGRHPNSQANLTYHEGRPPIYGETKKTHSVRITETGWDGLRALAQQQGCDSIAELLERLGRGSIPLVSQD